MTPARPGGTDDGCSVVAPPVPRRHVCNRASGGRGVRRVMMSLQPAFVLSLPRSGSTLLQRMLGAHPMIATSAEPWVLLPLFAARHERGVYARYNHRVAQRALTAFIGQLRDGERTYHGQVRRFAVELYERAADPEASIFVDKTPRYGLYADELIATFPDAPIVIMWRNPLAVVASLVRSWLDGRWMPYLHVVDLYDLLEALTAAVASHPGRFHQLRYEDLVHEPERRLRALLDHLGVPWDDRVLTNFSATDVRGPVGDRAGSLTNQTRVSTAATDRWPEAFESPVRRRWAQQYLAWIGRERLSLMGYDHARLRAQLAAAPLRWRMLPSDLGHTAKGVAWRILEPQIARDKWAERARPEWITSHG